MGFEKHINDHHNVWNYVYFMYYLQNKDSTEYSGIETYVRSRIDNDDPVWLPFLQTASIKQESGHSELVESQVDQLQRYMDGIQFNLEEKKFRKTGTIRVSQSDLNLRKDSAFNMLGLE